MNLSPDQVLLQFGTYQRSRDDCIPDPRIGKLLDHFRSTTLSFESIPVEELYALTQGKSHRDFGTDLFISTKIDGMSAFLIFNAADTDHRSYFCNAEYHRVWLGLPANIDIERILTQKKVQQIILAGELFAAPDPLETPPEVEIESRIGFDAPENQEDFNFNARCRVEGFMHCQRNPQSQRDLDRIGFRVYDVLEYAGEDLTKFPYSDRYRRFCALFPTEGRVATVHTFRMQETEISLLYEQVVVEGGAEGLVIRNSFPFHGFKVKPTQTLDAVIIAVIKEEAGTGHADIEQRVESALLGLRYSDGTYQMIGSAAHGLSKSLRQQLWQESELVTPNLIFSRSRFEDGRRFQFVVPKHVVEIRLLNVSGVHPNVILDFSATSKTWRIVKQNIFPSLRPGWFMENPIRLDKSVHNLQDVRIDQILPFLPEEMAELQESNANLHKIKRKTRKLHQ